MFFFRVFFENHLGFPPRNVFPKENEEKFLGPKKTCRNPFKKTNGQVESSGLEFSELKGWQRSPVPLTDVSRAEKPSKK